MISHSCARNHSRQLIAEFFDSFLKELSEYDDLYLYPTLESRVDANLAKINMIGGLAREREYLHAHWDNNDPVIQQRCLDRVTALGHQELINQIHNNPHWIKSNQHTAEHEIPATALYYFKQFDPENRVVDLNRDKPMSVNETEESMKHPKNIDSL